MYDMTTNVNERPESIERTRLRSSEMNALKSIAGAASLLENADKPLEKRLLLVGTRPARVKAMGTELLKILTRLTATISKDQLPHIRQNLSAMRVMVKVEDVSPGASCTYVSNETLAALCETVFADTCGLCGKTAQEARACRVKKALDACVYGDGLTVKDGCCYRTLNDLHDWGIST